MTNKQFFDEYCEFVPPKAFNGEMGTREYEKQAKLCGQRYGVIMENPCAGQTIVFNFNDAAEVIRVAERFDPNLLYWQFYVVDWSK